MKKFILAAFFLQSHVALGQVLETLQTIRSSINATQIAKCDSELTSYLEILKNLQENPQLKAESETQGKEILQSLFTLRAALRTHVLSYPSCANRVKEMITASRSLGDLVGIYSEKIKQVRSEQIKFQQQAIPLKQELSSYKTLGEKFPEFRSGDLMITKGVSFISSTISKVSQPASVYSHIVFVHRDEKKTETLESYIGDGAKAYDIDFALKNENARILLLRAKDQNLAAKADRYMYNRIKSGKIPYDYQLDFSDNKKLSCEEIAYEAYHYASSGQMKIPQFPAKISLRDPNFTDSIGLKNGELMAPADMETDPRFEVVTDWTDLRLVRDSWRKDTVMREMFRWMNELEYNFVNDLSYLGLKLFLGIRLVPLFGDLVSKWLSVASDAPNSALMSLDRIRTVGSLLLAELEKEDNAYFKRTGLWMSQKQLQKSLESLRKKDRHAYLDPNENSLFHQYFRENNLVAQ